MGRRYPHPEYRLCPFRCQRQRQVDGGGGFPTPPLPELTAMMFFTPFTPGWFFTRFSVAMLWSASSQSLSRR
jgi:hypothetical protein